MKLKKIASLALAGIMAVSMLTACGEGTSNSGSSSENTNTTSGYSAMLGQKAADTLAKNDLDDVFTFADNSGYVDDLEKAVRDEITPKNILDFVTNYTVQRLNDRVGNGVRAGLRDAFDENAELTRMYYENGWYINDNVNTQTIGDVWVANGNISMDDVLDTIFNTYKDDIASAEKTGTAVHGAANVEVNYDYDVAVSVVNVPLSNYTQINGSVNFIAVTFTRNAEIA